MKISKMLKKLTAFAMVAILAVTTLSVGLPLSKEGSTLSANAATLSSVQQYAQDNLFINKNGEDFESYTGTDHLSVWSNYADSNTIVPTSESYLHTVGDNTYLAPPTNQNVVMAMNKDVWPAGTLKQIEYDVLVPKEAVVSGNGDPNTRLLFYFDPETQAWAGWSIYYQAGVDANGNPDPNRDSIRFAFKANLFARVTGGVTGAILRNDGTNTTWNVDEKLHFTVTYNMEQDNVLGVKIKVSQGIASEVIYDYSYRCIGSYTAYNKTSFQPFAIAAPNLAESVVYFDNIKPTFDVPASKAADVYKSRYYDDTNDGIGILDKAATDITADDADMVCEAVEILNDFDLDTQATLSAERAKLVEFAKKLDSTYEAFATTYASLLATNIKDLDHSFDDAVDGALADYENLSELGKKLVGYTYLYKAKSKLRNLIVPTGDDYEDNSTITVDFEYDYNPFDCLSIYDEEICTARFATDPLDPNNNTFSLRTKYDNNMLFVMNEDLWPQRGQITKLQARFMYINRTSSYAPSGILYEWKDEENYSIIFWQGARIYAYYYRDGEYSGNKLLINNLPTWGNGPNGDKYYGYENAWCTFTLNYSDKGSISGGVEYETGEGKQSEAFSIPSYMAGARVGFYARSNDANLGDSGYDLVDDFSITFKKADFDVDDKIEDINVYFTQNTFITPNETILLNGEQLGVVVDKAEIYRLDDVASTTVPKYVNYGNFRDADYSNSALHANSNKEYANEIVTAPQDFVFDASQAREIEIVQRTLSGIKMIVPTDLTSANGGTGEGVYALRLTHKNGTTKTLLINVPVIQLVMGNEGKISTPGSVVEVSGYNLTRKRDKDAVKLVLRSTKDRSEITLPVDEIHNDDYYIKFTLPENIAKGTYELYIHSGLGDELCWTAPGIVTVGDAPSASWKTDVYYPETHGAKPDGLVNCTAAFVKVLNECYLNGGGIIELQEGIYRVEHTLAIPQNTRIIGKGSGNTTILMTNHGMQYGEDAGVFAVTGNCEVKGLNVWTTRAKYMFNTNKVQPNITGADGVSYASGAGDNIKIDDCIFKLQSMAGAIFGGSPMSPITKDGLAQILFDECQRNKAKINVGDQWVTNTNIRCTNMEVRTELVTHAGLHGDYLYINNILYRDLHASQFLGYRSMVQNSEFEGVTTGYYGDFMYAYNNNMHGTKANNREIMTLDGGPRASNLIPRFIGDDLDMMEKYTGVRRYDDSIFVYQGQTFKDDAMIGLFCNVQSGQGMGQQRMVIDNGVYYNPTDKTNYYWFKVQTPFAVNPNRNSRLWIMDRRNNTIYSNNRHEDGGPFSLYGGGMMWTIDNCSWKRCTQVGTIPRQGINWYTAFTNCTFLESESFVHASGSGSHGGKGEGVLRFADGGAIGRYTFLVGIVKNCALNDYAFAIGQGTNAFPEILVEGNTAHTTGQILYNCFSPQATSGVLIRNNDFETTSATPFDGDYINAINGNYVLNSLRSPKYIIWLKEDGVLGIDKGDANGDGKISLKDVTFIKCYVVQATTATADQIAKGDVNGDGKLTTRDANMIRKYILDGSPFNDAEQPDGGSTSSSAPSSSQTTSVNSSLTGGDEYFPGIW